MDPEQYRDAHTRLEEDYLSGAISADEYMRLRRQLHERASVDESASQQGIPAEPVADPLAGVRLASWGSRAAALVLDWLLLLGVMVVVSIWAFATADPATDEPGDLQASVLALSIFVLPSVYQWVLVGVWGQTLGKMALGVRVVRAENAGRIGFARALGRVASTWVLGFLVLPLLLAYLWPLWDRRNQTLYDKMAATIVVRAR